MGEKSATRWLRALWAGAMPLPEAFWWYGIAYGFLVNAGATLAALGLATLDAPGWLLLAVYLSPLPYNLLVLVGVWRSAAAWPAGSWWPELARLAIALWVIAATAL